MSSAVAYSFLIITLIVLSGGLARANDDLRPLTGDDLKTATEMSRTYASHMFSTVCVKNLKAYSLPKILTEQETAQRVQKFQKSCDCVTDQVMQYVAPNDVIDFVTNVYGTRVSQKTAEGQVIQMERSPAFIQINRISRDETVRKGCGLPQ